MKLLFFLRDITDCGGVQQTTCTNINALLDEGFKVETVSLYHKYEDTFFQLNNSVKRYTLFEHKVEHKKDFLSIRNKVKIALREIDFEVLVIQDISYSVFIPFDTWRTHKIIVCEHGRYFMGKVFGIHWIGAQIALRKANAIVCLTDLDAKNYRQRCRRDIPIYNIYNAINHAVNEVVYSSCSKIIVSCGSLDNVKRFEDAIEAAKVVFDTYPDWQWYIYGDGNYRSKLLDLIYEYKLDKNVFLMGYEKNKEVIYGEKAFLVLTSRFEGFGMVLTEAMQYGLPIISYDINYGPKEIIKEDINGYLVPDGDINALANKIIKLIENKENRMRLSAGAYQSLSDFSLKKITDQWIDLFRAI